MTSLYASLEKGRPYILSVLRIVVALLFMEHGLQKYFGFPSAGPPMRTLLYVQGVIEIVGGILLLIGAYTRVVAFILAGDMAVAFFIAHFPRSNRDRPAAEPALFRHFRSALRIGRCGYRMI